MMSYYWRYRQISNRRRTLVGNKIVDQSDVVGASPVQLQLQLRLHSRLNTWLHWIGQRELQDDVRNIQVWWFGAPYIRDITVSMATTHQSSCLS